MSPELPLVIGAARNRLPGDRGDQLVYGDGDGVGVGVVVYAAAAIPGVVLSEHRPCVLVIDDVRWRVDFVDREGGRFVYRCSAWQPGPFEREGAVVVYDPERVHNERVERLSTTARAAAFLLFLPVLPVLGLLPSSTKEALRARGLMPHGGQLSSIYLEWMLLLFVVACELLFVVIGLVVPAILCGAVALVLIVDVLHRVVMANAGSDAGMFAWVRQLGQTFLSSEGPPADEPTNKGDAVVPSRPAGDAPP